MVTPARKQYLDIKKQHPDEILLFRMGDFYETFDGDARIVAKELEIALTAREMGKGGRIPLAGIPYHALDGYLARLIKKGYKVAICEQTSDPATSKGIVDREVVRVVTPGTVIEDSILDRRANNHLAAVIMDGDSAGLAYVDITTAEFATSQFPAAHLPVELARLMPAEVLRPKDMDGLPAPDGVTVTAVDDTAFHLEWSRDALLQHFGVGSLEAYGCDRLPLAIRAAGAILDYIGRNQKSALGQLTSLYTYSTEQYMVLDPQTRRNLELYEGGRWADKQSSLLSVLDRTKTSMGARMLRRWLGQPLLSVPDLERRLDAVEWFHRSALRRGRIISVLENVSDIERLVNKVRGFSATPRDLVALGRSMECAPHIWEVLWEDEDAPKVEWITKGVGDQSEVVQLIKSAVADDPPLSVGDGKTIRPGFSPDLDNVRNSSRRAQEYIASLEKTERERTGIKSLKVSYNKVFGYYIEVSNPNLAQVPSDYIRRQTITTGERFITPEMKEYESQVLNAQERVSELEISLFRQVCGQVASHAGAIIEVAQAIAHVDAFGSLGEVASVHGYVRPALNDGEVIDVKDGRHPVVERTLEAGAFVPNDMRLSNTDDQLIILTGPNMAGKSTFIRQAAIIVLMAQCGSFVPAASATIGLVDRIFTRVGLQDDLSTGQSTFMVEMVETAAILNHATRRSLVILDEIGRGTSTYDGLAIARAIAEYIHSHPRLGCKTLFATHYHELIALAETLPRVRNFNVAVSEDRGNIAFLRRIVPGGADKSYGVYVARLAGLPTAVVNRAWEVLRELEERSKENGAHPGASSTAARGPSRRPKVTPPQQLSLMGNTPPVLSDLLSLDVSSMTPIEAINKLYGLQEKAKRGNQ
ncbi:MAG: DNA mismatch repair protein MutS [SAR202 cluster bacterium]|nr:DNA mismatch repair protein MutS [SAR202 cluster bacterium]